MDAFCMEGTAVQLKKQFERNLQRIAFMGMGQELKIRSVGKNEEQDVQNTPRDFVPNATVSNEEGHVE